ncbi:hypothetical protein [Nostoc sp.]
MSNLETNWLYPRIPMPECDRLRWATGATTPSQSTKTSQSLNR